MSDPTDNEEDSEPQESVEELFDDVETAKGESDTGDTTSQRAAQVSQATDEQVDWNTLIENLEDVTNLIREYFEQSRENKRVENERKQSYFKHQQRIVLTAAGTFLIVIGIAAWMTYSDALSGDAFTFVLGTLFGSILTFLQNMIGQRDNEESG
ncbi:hypothetical protein [Halosimplex sp. TS25]|uniref:hypothetical protein n=1 Tax=Halosimplex rarum TaxID=3396619 RepID=UPI0039EA0F50